MTLIASMASASLLLASSASASTVVNCSSSTYSCASYGYAGDDGGYSYSKFNSSKGHNCTTYIAWLLWNSLDYHSEFNLLGNAGEWAASAKKLKALGVTVSSSAKQWSVAQWVSGNHVAFVESVSIKNGKTVIVVTEDNYTANVTRRKTITFGDSDWPDNFINFGIFAPPPGAQFAPLTSLLNEEAVARENAVAEQEAIISESVLGQD